MPLDVRRVSRKPSVPLVIFDGACGFCRFWVERWRALTRDRFAWVPSQSAASQFPEIAPEEFDSAMQLVETDGSVRSGADAVVRLLEEAPRWRWIAWGIQRLPGILSLMRVGYDFIARHRTAFSWLTRLLWGRDPSPPAFLFARRIFGTALGLVLFVAFASFAWQVRGLIGKNGISPAGELLGMSRDQLGSNAFWNYPTLFWAGSSDGALITACVAGMIIAGLVIAGIAPGACSLLAWALYLSLCTVATPFLDFQWDSLLLEASLLSAIFLPWTLRPRWNVEAPISRLGRWLLWWLLFRLMLESGAVKLASGDPTWRNLTALDYHFETQPLPLWTAWYAHHSPALLHRISTLVTFAIEFVAPFGIFAPRRVRHCAGAAMFLLQLSILFTGNYAFFNWLTIALVLLLIDDSIIPVRWQAPTQKLYVPSNAKSASVFAIAPFAAVVLVLTTAQLLASCGFTAFWTHSLAVLHRTLAPFRSINSYGLFAVMTTQRPEIMIEGSHDGQTWEEYHFRWKPDDISECPKWVAPHQPRLDWQMWFAALGNIRENSWFVRLMVRLMEGSPEVLALLSSPTLFEHRPPKYVRAVLYEYHFTDDGAGAAWWRRELLGLYCPPLSLRSSPGEQSETPSGNN